jgi:hypothetical protein
MPDTGQLYVFLDLDWGNHWVWSVRYENGTRQLRAARVPAGLPKAYSTRATWGWPQRDEDWPRLLPSWSLQPVLVPVTTATVTATAGTGRTRAGVLAGPIDLGPALADVDGAVSPRATTRTGTTTTVSLSARTRRSPHDWQAVRIATGLLLARHLRPAGGIPHGEADAASFADAVRRWSDRAAHEQPRDRLTEDDSDAVWQLFLDFQSVTLYSLSDAVNESLDATWPATRRVDLAARRGPGPRPDPARARQHGSAGSARHRPPDDAVPAELRAGRRGGADRRVAAPAGAVVRPADRAPLRRGRPPVLDPSRRPGGPALRPGRAHASAY